jgi:hypothetical protein
MFVACVPSKEGRERGIRCRAVRDGDAKEATESKEKK